MPWLQELRLELALPDLPLLGQHLGARSRTIASCCWVDSPSGDTRSPLARSCFCSAATRIMKNSSRFVPTIARNLTRSSSGWLVVARLRQHALVEGEPAQLAVEVEIGASSEGAWASTVTGAMRWVRQSTVPTAPAGTRYETFTRGFYRGDIGTPRRLHIGCRYWPRPRTSPRPVVTSSAPRRRPGQCLQPRRLGEAQRHHLRLQRRTHRWPRRSIRCSPRRAFPTRSSSSTTRARMARGPWRPGLPA